MIPRQVHDFAKTTGQRAKTDRIDADLRALFAARVCQHSHRCAVTAFLLPLTSPRAGIMCENEGSTGTDVSTRRADISLADGDFAVVVAAVEEGRGTSGLGLPLGPRRPVHRSSAVNKSSSHDPEAAARRGVDSFRSSRPLCPRVPGR